MRKNKDGKVRGTSPGNTVPIVQPIRNAQPKVGRNDPCPCRSGKKYKDCCGGRRAPVPKVAMTPMAAPVSRFAVAASLKRQGIAAPDAYAFTQVGTLGWTAARQRYEQMLEAEQTTFWEQAERELCESTNSESCAVVV